MNKKSHLLFWIFSLFLSLLGNAQDVDSLSTYHLNDVIVSTPRLPERVDDTPFSITVIDTSLIKSERQNLSIKEHLQMVPSVYVQNAYNFTQDARISIRGFGATAAFGIRGIKLIVDGIPETTPDGTGQLDNLNLDFVDKIKVIRGSAASLYGNASGGAIIIRSKSDFEKNYFSAQSMIGSYGFYSHSLSGGANLEKSAVTGHIRLFGSGGFRNHSEFSQINSRLTFKHDFSERLKAHFLLEYVNSPKAQDAGGLTLEETETDFSLAREQNVTFDAGEEITQWKAGTSLQWKWSENKTLNTYAFFNQRSFTGRLPYESSGIIELKRNYLGVGNSLDVRSRSNKIKLGYDFLSQADDRQRFDNVEGIQGNNVFDQVESFHNLGLYLLDYIAFRQWSFAAGIRNDINWVEATDNFLSDGDDSGARTLTNWSYHIGATRKISQAVQFFVNHATNFETPTLNQLSNRPDNSGGFENLSAATTQSFEIGMRWSFHSLSGEITGFINETKNELVPFELEAYTERTFFRNAGSTLRKGLEFSAKYISPIWKVYSAYTLSGFEYDEYVNNGDDLAGFNLPGIPQHHATVNVLVEPIENLEVSLPIDYVGSLFADDQNEVSIDGYLELNFSAKYRINTQNVAITPSIGVRNSTNQEYFDNIRINAFGGRYYEPAPKRNFYLGLALHIR